LPAVPRDHPSPAVQSSFRWAAWLLLGQAGLVALAAIGPLDPQVWALENLLTVFFCGYLALTARSFPLSRVSYALIFVFLTLHQIGAHFTYSQVPYDAAWQALVGWSLHEALGWERNHYDRLVHFCYGLLMAYPIREAMLRIAGVRGFWGYFLPLDVTMSTSLVYELIEWAAVIAFGDGAGMDFVGSQGDPWDAHADMLLAAIGALLAMLVIAAVNSALQHDFAQDWADSVRVKQRRPLGENALARMVREDERTSL
jgi:putative membrane protein